MIQSDPVPISPASTDPLVVVSIVAMACPGFVVDCVRALLAGTYERFAVMIVENGGADAFTRLERELVAAGLFSGVESIPTGHQTCRRGASGRAGVPLFLFDPGDNLGYAGGNNVVLAQSVVSDWEAAWILNPDTIPQPGALQALVERQRESGFGMIGSRLLYAASGRVQTWGGLGWNLWLGRGRYLGHLSAADETPTAVQVERQTRFVSGASTYVTRTFVEAVGPMDDSFFMFCEDVDWGLRGASRGLGYAHASVVIHIHGGTSGSSRVRGRRSPFSVYLAERNKVLLMRKHLGYLAPAAIALALPFTLEHLLRGRSWGLLRAALAGWLAGARGETGQPTSTSIPSRGSA